MGRRNGWGGESCGVERAVGWRALRREVWGNKRLEQVPE